MFNFFTKNLSLLKKDPLQHEAATAMFHAVFMVMCFVFFCHIKSQ